MKVSKYFIIGAEKEDIYVTITKLLNNVTELGSSFAYETKTNIENIFTGGDIITGAKTLGVAGKCGKDFAKYVIEHTEKK